MATEIQFDTELIQSWYRAPNWCSVLLEQISASWPITRFCLLSWPGSAWLSPTFQLVNFWLAAAIFYKAQQHQYQRLTEVWWPRKYLDYFKLQLVLQCSVILNYKWFLYWVRSIDKQCTTVINIYVSERMRGGSNEFLVTQDKVGYTSYWTQVKSFL